MSQPPNFRKKLLPAQSVLSLNGPHLVKYMVNEPVLFVRARDHQLVVSLKMGGRIPKPVGFLRLNWNFMTWMMWGFPAIFLKAP